MNAAATQFRTYIHNWAQGWDRFWFSPTDPMTLAVIRILAGAMLFYTHAVWLLDFDAFFGEYPWLDSAVLTSFAGREMAWSHFNWVQSPVMLRVIHVVALLTFLLLTVGLWTRPISVVAFLFAVSYANRLPGALFGLDQVNSMLAMYLMIGPSGAVLSLDNLRARRRTKAPLDSFEIPQSTAANIAIRLIQIHLCIIYLFSGLGKLLGARWWDGTAIWGAVANLEYQSIDMTWLANWPMLVEITTHVIVFWEVFYIALIWPRLTRPIMLAIAVPLHLGIALFLGMITFGLIMLVANLAFVPPQFFRAILSSRGSSSRAGEGTSSGQNDRQFKSSPAAITRRRPGSR